MRTARMTLLLRHGEGRHLLRMLRWNSNCNMLVPYYTLRHGTKQSVLLFRLGTRQPINPGSIPPQARDFSPVRLTQPSVQWIPTAPSPGVRRPRREADYSSPCSADVRNDLTSCTSVPLYTCTGHTHTNLSLTLPYYT
jgi:hypothetical protein